MKVKHPTETPQTSGPDISRDVEDDEATTSSSTDNNSTTPEKPHTGRYESLPSYEDQDTDLVFEHDELLRNPEAQSILWGPKVWQVKGLPLILSALEATVAVKRGLYTYEELAIYTPPTPPSPDPSDPVSGALSAALSTIGTIAERASDYPLLLSKVLDSKQENRADEIAKFANDPSKGVTGIVSAGLRAPMDITMNVSRGFYNLPKLYGDETVREVEKVKDFGSGLEAAGKGFGLGLWDGISGLVTQPLKGAEEGGFMGGLIGFGKGIGGAVFKPAAGAVGIPGNLFQGIYEEVQKTRRVGVEYETREAQMLQGFREWDAATEEDRKRIYEKIKREIEDLETLES